MVSPLMAELWLERLESEDTIAEMSGSGKAVNTTLSQRWQINHLVDSTVWIYNRTWLRSYWWHCTEPNGGFIGGSRVGVIRGVT